MKRAYYLAALAALVLVSLTVLAVQPARGQEQGQEEPTTGVARVSLVHGDVTSMRGDSGDWVAATVNAPLVRGDKIATGENSQVEIQLDYANVLRLAPRTEATIADLTRSRIQIQVAQGVANYSVLKGSEAEAEIDTPNMAVRPLEEGAYRIEVTSPTETQLIVRKGQAEVSNPDGSTRVESGRMIRVQGSDHPEYQIASAPGNDEWDKWNRERDNQINDAQSYSHANRYYTGAQDLDRNGRWVYVPEYGDYAWTPYAGAGWVPYRDGYWGWEPYWGWTWISYEPWGWAPYHYGRWFYWGSSWYWWPGHHGYGYRPMWGPAYVSFLGFGFGGRNWGFGFGYGYNSIGWCPLGPYDSYHPWWGRHNSYRAVNIANITNINNYNSGTRRPLGPRGYTSNLQAALTNDRIRGAITQASTEDFARGRVPRQQARIDANTLRQGQLVQGTIPAVPTRETLRPVNRPANAAAFSGRTGGAQTFFSRQQPPATTRSFAQQSAAIQQMVQRNPLQGGGQTARSAGTSDLSRQSAVTVQGATAQRATPGAGNLPAVNAGRATSSVNGRAAGTNSGWSSFGQATASSSARTAAGQAAAGTERSQQAGPATRSAASPAASPSQQRPGWQRFGTGQARAVPNRPTTTGTPQGTSSAPARAGGERFGGSRQAPASAAPRVTVTPSNASGVESRPAPRSAVAPSGFQSFSRQSQASVESRPAPTSQQTPGWSRFSSTSSSSERPALDIRKPIVTERAAPRSYGGGGTGSGWGNRQQSAPTPPPRNFQGGRAAPTAPPSTYQGGGWGGGRSAAPQGSYGGGGNRGWSGGGGGNRGWSAPSGGGGGRSVQSAPSRSYGGGGGGGGGRGASAPSGGGHGSSGSHSGGGNRGPR
jgi:hypothetical protein